MVYRLYVDESGDHTYNQLEKPQARYLGLTGIIIEGNYYKTKLSPELMDLTEAHFPCDSPDEPTILHREDIIYRKGAFGRLCDERCKLAWEEAWLEFLKCHTFRIISVVVDKKYHQAQYQVVAMHPYHLCLMFILERYCAFLRIRGSKGDVLAESRGGKEDSALKQAYLNLWSGGTYYRSSGFIQSTLTSKNIKLKKKDRNIAGLQLADLLAYTCKRDILDDVGCLTYGGTPFAEEIRRAVLSKYNVWERTGAVWGYGKKYFGER